MRVVAGFDGGATKTKAVIATLEGEALSTGESGPSNYHVVGMDGARKSILNAFRAASSSLGSDLSVEVAVAGLAGLDCEHDRIALNEELPKVGIAERFMVVHDSKIALYGATGGGAGVIVIAGTGSVAAGADGEGNWVRVGGWGNVLDDAGSAYDIARRALAATLYAFDGRGPKTVLEDRIKAALKVDSTDDIIRRVYDEKMSVTEIAALAPVVTAAAKEGDPVAISIVNEAAAGISTLVKTVISRLGMEGRSFPVATIGGVFKAGEMVTGPFIKSVKALAPRARIGQPMMGPWLGSVLVALEEYHGHLSPELVSNLARTASKL